MASRGVQIPDTFAALHGPQPVFPGEFVRGGDAKEVYVFPVCSTVDSRGRRRFWRVTVRAVDLDGLPLLFDREDWLKQPVPVLPRVVGIVETASWLEGGDMRQGGIPTQVFQGKNVGKSNATNSVTQALRDALGLYLKYSHGRVVEEAPLREPPSAEAKLEAAEARPPPMLVKKIGETVQARLTEETFLSGVTAQRKYNGQRMVAFSSGSATCASSRPENDAPCVPEEVVLYSRTGRDFPGMVEIRRNVACLLRFASQAWGALCLEKKINPWNMCREAGAALAGDSPKVYLDGELYKHGWSLNTISGHGRSRAGGDELEFWVYDCFFPQLAELNVPVSSKTRQTFLDILFALAEDSDKPDAGCARLKFVNRVENFSVSTLRDLEGLAKRFIIEGYEGAIARKDLEPYRYGTNNYHSSNLVKIKPLFDSEYPVVGFTQGTRGKDVGAVIWICEVPAEQSKTGTPVRFNVVPKNMDYATRYKIFEKLVRTPDKFDFFRGLPLTVEYPELSAKTGIPSQAKALGFRVYEPRPDEPEVADPIVRLLSQ